MRTANLAIVFTDIKGFTERTSGQTLEENERLLAAHSGLLGPLFRAFGGKIVKSIGDAFMVSFESPTQAVLAGVAIQDRLWRHNREAPTAERFEVRIGINVGEVRLEGSDCFGEPVNIASRVEHEATPGEVYFTEAVYLAMNKAEVPSEVVGDFELKGIPGKIKIYRVPKAPYRVEPAQAGATGDGPPYGNLGLAKLSEEPAGKAWAPTAELGEKAAELGAKAAQLGGQLVEKTSAALLSGRAKRSRVSVIGSAIALIVMAAVAVWATRPGPIEAAIQAVESAPAKDRTGKLDEARRLIDQLPEAGERSYYLGRLAEARGDHSASSHYVAAARGGFKKASGRLEELLEHPKCRFRREAAEAVAELKLTSAQGALEELAEKGGADDDDVPLIGCNSKRAAAHALERLKL